ncbi:MAG: amidase [Steroidobacteraceae bacterium]
MPLRSGTPLRGYVGVAAVSCLTSVAAAAGYNLTCKSGSAVSADLAAHRITSQALVADYRARIARVNPEIHAVIGLNPDAMAEARAADARRAASRTRGPLDGLPILVKDNIGIAGLPTTAGSLALLKNIRPASSTVIRNLKRAGVVILGRANLSEWANIRSEHSTSGWSAVGGLTRNPYMLDRSACGSSSGSAAAVAAGLAAAAIGTETDGSISCPASMNGLVGLKPTVGLVSRTGIVPISHTQDTAGPITRTVRDAAMLLTAMAGSDPADPATKDANAHRIDYTTALNARALTGVRLGVARFLVKGFTPGTRAVFDRALAVLKAQGAVLIDVDDYDMAKLGKNEGVVLQTELKADLNSYLAGSPPAVTSRTLAGLIAFDDSHPQEMTWFGQGFFVKAERTKGLADPAYVKAHETNLRLAGPDGIDRLLKEHGVVALISPTQNPAFVIDLVNGDSGGGGDSSLPAIAGYPYITVPMGEVHGLPVGLSFIGRKWSEARLLGLAYSYEQATHAWRPPTFAPDVLHPRAPVACQ